MRIKIFFFNEQRNFYYLLGSVLIIISFTHPFLRYPYDIIHHLLYIDKYYNVTEIPSGRWIWHFFWAKFFYFFQIPNSEIFFRARIIHLIQTYIAFFSVFYFSKVVFRNLYKDIDSIVLQYMALWSTIIWFTIFATHSMDYHLVWSLWYSVNYQITLPLFWYITALTFVLILEETSIQKKIFYIIQILLISRFILQAHSMEYLYYLMYMLILSIVFIDRLWLLLKRYFYIILPIVVVVVFIAKQYQPEHSKIFNYLSWNKLPQLYQLIIKDGISLVDGFNRSYATINELMFLIYYLAIIMFVLVIRNYLKKEAEFINMRVFLFVCITSLFAVIPLYVLSAGLFSIITRANVVNRIYYSSSLFIFLPLFTYYILRLFTHYKVKVFSLNILIFGFLVVTYFYSKNVDSFHHNYYKNIVSIKNSFSERKYGFNLSQEQINIIGRELKKYDTLSNAFTIYYARADIAFVLKYIYRKNVYWKGRRANPDYIKIYNYEIKNNKQNIILFKTPKGFPDYEPYK